MAACQSYPIQLESVTGPGFTVTANKMQIYFDGRLIYLIPHQARAGRPQIMHPAGIRMTPKG